MSIFWYKSIKKLGVSVWSGYILGEYLKFRAFIKFGKTAVFFNIFDYHNKLTSKSLSKTLKGRKLWGINIKNWCIVVEYISTFTDECIRLHASQVAEEMNPQHHIRFIPKNLG